MMRDVCGNVLQLDKSGITDHAYLNIYHAYLNIYLYMCVLCLQLNYFIIIY
jgi:hypothetical protein